MRQVPEEAVVQPMREAGVVPVETEATNARVTERLEQLRREVLVSVVRQNVRQVERLCIDK